MGGVCLVCYQFFLKLNKFAGEVMVVAGRTGETNDQINSRKYSDQTAEYHCHNVVRLTPHRNDGSTTCNNNQKVRNEADPVKKLTAADMIPSRTANAE